MKNNLCRPCFLFFQGLSECVVGCWGGGIGVFGKGRKMVEVVNKRWVGIAGPDCVYIGRGASSEIRFGSEQMEIGKR